MKKQPSIPNMINFALIIALAIWSCQDSKTQIGTHEIKLRATDCNDCSPDCCCFVELDDDNAATLLFCGTVDGASACSVTACNQMLVGGGQLITLNTTTPRKLFCMGLAGAFRITNFSATDPADFIISCQTESGIPQTIEVHLDPGGDFIDISTDNACEVDPC